MPRIGLPEASLVLANESDSVQPQSSKWCGTLREKSLWRMDVGYGKWWLALFCLALAVSMQAQPPSSADEATRKLAVDIFKQLIEINTTDSVGSVTAASEAMAKRFRDAGFPESDIKVLGPSSNDRKKNVVVRLHGSGKHKPVLLIGHLDVVEARREDWTTDPFQFVEKDGFYYGRGTSDMKDGDAIMSATLVRMKKEGS